MGQVEVGVPREAVQEQVDKILRSDELHGSEVLRNLLSFLVRHSIDRPADPPKEYELGVAVLGKNEKFDPRLDSAVRVHAARLRSKLAEYYMADGSADPVLIEMPKGSYQVNWRYRREEAPAAAPVTAERARTAGLPWKGFAAGFGVALVLAGIAVSFWPARAMAPAVRAFWSAFLKSPEPPLIVFSNHRFAGTSASGLRIFRDGVDRPGDYNDTYSGTGTVMAVAELTNLFTLGGRTPRLKRAELLTWDETKHADVVFVGAPMANSRLRELALLRHFRFKPGNEEPHWGVGGIVNLHPAPGEEPIYLGSRPPYTYDYAVVALLPGFDRDRKVALIAGTNTYGCQGAAEFMSREDSVTRLFGKLGREARPGAGHFEAVLKVTVRGGVPLEADIVAVRPREMAQ